MNSQFALNEFVNKDETINGKNFHHLFLFFQNISLLINYTSISILLAVSNYAIIKIYKLLKGI